MRILFITHYSALLGANRSLLHLVKGLQQYYGVQPLVLCPKEGVFTEALNKAGIPFRCTFYLQAAYSIRSKGLLLYPFRYLFGKKKYERAVLEIAATFQPDHIHSNSSVTAIGYYLAAALAVPHSVHIREFGWQDYNLIYPSGRGALLAKMQQASAVVAISRSIAEAWDGENKLPMHILFNGIGDQEELKKRGNDAKKKINSIQKSVFLMIGLLQPAKRQHEALRAFSGIAKKFPEARLVLAGPGQKLYTLRLKIETLVRGLNRQVQFTGYVPDPGPLYRSASVALMCSRHEAMGRVTAEAMSYGLPVFGYKGGATPEIIRNGENGFLYHNTQALQTLMEDFLREKFHYASLSENAHRHALSFFSDENYTEGFWKIITANNG